MRARLVAVVVFAVWSCDPPDGMASCPARQFVSATVLEGWGAGGGRWREGGGPPGVVDVGGAERTAEGTPDDCGRRPCERCGTR